MGRTPEPNRGLEMITPPDSHSNQTTSSRVTNAPPARNEVPMRQVNASDVSSADIARSGGGVNAVSDASSATAGEQNKQRKASATKTQQFRPTDTQSQSA
jgi:hypothetical protein